MSPPVVGANVEMDGERQLTDTTGNCTFTLNPGAYTYTISAAGFQTLTGQITVTQQASFTFNLIPIGGGGGGPKKLGFWVDWRDIWSGSPYRGGPITPDILFADYFGTQPFPAAMKFTINLNRATTAFASTVANFLGTLLGLMSAHANTRLIVTYFVDAAGPWDTTGKVTSAQALSNFDTLMNSLKGHSNVEGVQAEFEYVTGGVSPAIIQAFISEVEKFGLSPIAFRVNEPLWTKFLDYSQYPYFNDTIHPVLSPGSIGEGYGETGAPSVGPVWTQAAIANIITNSPGNPYVLVYCEADKNNPAGNAHLWNSPTLRGWIWNDPAYQADYTRGVE